MLVAREGEGEGLCEARPLGSVRACDDLVAGDELDRRDAAARAEGPREERDGVERVVAGARAEHEVVAELAALHDAEHAPVDDETRALAGLRLAYGTSCVHAPSAPRWQRSRGWTATGAFFTKMLTLRISCTTNSFARPSVSQRCTGLPVVCEENVRRSARARARAPCPRRSRCGRCFRGGAPSAPTRARRRSR